MQVFTEEYLTKFISEYAGQTSYANRLSVFEKHFHVIFDLFPAFDPSLAFLNNPDQIGFLTGMYRKDGAIYSSLKKEFRIDKRVYVFDVRPVNSYRPVFNNYIIEGFISADTKIGTITGAIEKNGHYIEKAPGVLMEECEQAISAVYNYLQKNKGINFRAQFMKVFYDGYNDHMNGVPKTFDRKKKIIELYLYSQGLLFSEYRQQLKAIWLQQEIQEQVTETDDFKILDWRDQVLMLKNMGMLDILKEKIQHPAETVKMKKINRIICLIIGQQPYMIDSIADFINLIE